MKETLEIRNTFFSLLLLIFSLGFHHQIHKGSLSDLRSSAGI